jgi:UDP-N-acetylmuramoylalanine--D-glutamate ligase
MSPSWKKRRVLIIGIARQGIALARYLVAQGADVTLNDQRSAEQLAATRQALADLPVSWALGGHPLSLLDGMEIVCVSGGVPLSLPIVQEAQRRGLPISNDTQIFLESVPCKVIGITGSAGKTTTTTLVGQIAQASHPHPVWVGGNIGQPLVEQLDEIQHRHLVVLELSSFQLELTTLSPQISAVLNITPNHLDRHGTMQAYTAAKARILDFQTENDTAVLNLHDCGSAGLANRVRGKLVWFGLEKPPAGAPGSFVKQGQLFYTDGKDAIPLFHQECIQLRGTHNLLNVLAACAIAISAGLPAEALMQSVINFGGVPHRLELVRTWRNVRWYNDSIATAPERSIAAIRSFSEPLVLMLGGRDKNLPWESLAALIAERVDKVVVFGEAAEKILAALHAAQSKARIIQCANLKEAVGAAAELAQAGDVVLFSPGGTSFDEFVDFEQRGERFRQWVNELT